MSRDRDTFERFQPPDRGRFGDNEQAVTGNDSVRSDLTDVDIVIHGGTPKALFVSLDGMGKTAKCLPRSLIEIEHKPGFVRGENRDGQIVDLRTATVTLPRWLARREGLI